MFGTGHVLVGRCRTGTVERHRTSQEKLQVTNREARRCLRESEQGGIALVRFTICSGIGCPIRYPFRESDKRKQGKHPGKIKILTPRGSIPSAALAHARPDAGGLRSITG